MVFAYVNKGVGWRLADSLNELALEIRANFPDCYCLGTLGDTTHSAEGYSSDHNPFIIGPDGLGIVRAIDIGGPDATLKAIRQHAWDLYNAHDNRLWPYGYAKGCSDNLINNWTDHGQAPGTHVDTGDAGHLHISVTQVNGNAPSPSGYVAAIDDPRPWEFGDDDMAASPYAIIYHVDQATLGGAAWPGDFVFYPASGTYLHIPTTEDEQSLSASGAITTTITYAFHTALIEALKL